MLYLAFLSLLVITWFIILECVKNKPDYHNPMAYRFAALVWTGANILGLIGIWQHL